MKRHTTRKRNRKFKREHFGVRYLSKDRELRIREEFARSICKYIDDGIVKDLMNHVNKRVKELYDSILPWQRLIIFDTNG